LAAISYVQFDLDDELDMIKESRMSCGLSHMGEESDFGELAAYSGKKYPQTSAVYAPGTDNEEYYAYCSAIQFLFIRSYREKETRKKIALDFFPTCLRLDNF